MPYFRIVLALAAALVAVPVPVYAQANGPIYMCVDEQGRRSFTNVRSEMKGRKCERQNETTLPLAPAGKPAAKGAAPASPPDFPKVDAGTQKARDDVRHKVLAEELASEQKLLNNATQDLTGARAPRAGEDRSSQKYLERVGEAEKTVQRHRANVESIQREIGTLK